MALITASSVMAGTLYKCVGSDGVNSYVSHPDKGMQCTAFTQYESAPQPQPVARNATAPTTATMPVPPTTAAGAANADSTFATEQAPAADAITVGNVQDFGDPHAAAALAKIEAADGGFHYVQIGDSHTAGDYLTGQLRERLQARMGDGGTGWAMPMAVPGQRLARVKYDDRGWRLINSRTTNPSDYPFGGFIAQVASAHASLTLGDRLPTAAQNVTAIIRQNAGDQPLLASDADGRQVSLRSPALDGAWHAVTFQARLPLTVTADDSPSTALGGWWLEGSGRGAVVSAVGINGSEQSQWSRWRDGWMQDLAAGQPDMIALAYGTNEAFGRNMDAGVVKADLDTAIDRLRQQFPSAAILIIGAPESLVSRGGSCGIRAPALDAMQAIQRQVAKEKRTLYWNWQQAMGGTCSMKRWMAQGLSRGDGVHFSAAGYTRLGDDLYQGLTGLADHLAGGGAQPTTTASALSAPRIR